MNKLVLVLGVAAVAAVSGCLDPNYKGRRGRTAPVATGPAPSGEVAYGDDVQDTVRPVDVATTPAISEEQIPVAPAPAPKTLDATPAAPAPAPKTTTYVVQSGDTLSKISKRFNIKIDAIKKANPQIKGDVVKLGQKIELPGDVEVPAPAPAPKAPAVKPYTGATEQYKIKPGDTLGAIAKARGTTVAQLKQMNGMENDIVRTGRTLVVPAGKAAAAPAAKPAAKTAAAAPAPAPVKAAAAEEPAAAVEEPAPGNAGAAANAAEAAAPAVEQPAPASKQGDFFIYTVKDGEDVTGISITFDVSPAEIRQMNNLAEDAELAPGTELKLPLPAQQ